MTTEGWGAVCIDCDPHGLLQFDDRQVLAVYVDGHIDATGHHVLFAEGLTVQVPDGMTALRRAEQEYHERAKVEPPAAEDGRTMMRFPLPVTWETVSRAVGAVYDSTEGRTGLDTVGVEVRLELHADHDTRPWLDVVTGPYTDAP